MLADLVKSLISPVGAAYSRSQIDDVAKYVLNQEQHHAGRSFKDEYVALLNRFEVDFDERYLFNWIEK